MTPRTGSASALLLILGTAGSAWADAAADCRNRDLDDAQRLPLCTAALASAADDRDRADLLLWRGAILDRQGDLEGALADFDAAQALAPDWADPLVERAWALHARGDTDVALADLERARAVEPGSIYAFQESLNILGDAGRPQECLDLAAQALSLAPEEGYIHAYAGRCQHDSGQLGQAVVSYRRAAELGVEEGFLRANMASALLELGRIAEALPEAQAGAELAPDEDWPQAMLVRSLLAAGDHDGAIAAFRAAQPLIGEDEEGIANNLAWGLYLAGRHAEGLAIIEERLAAGTGAILDPGAEFDTYAHLLAASGRADEAAKAFLKAVEADGEARRATYMASLSRLGFGDIPDFGDALRACAATGAACQLDE